MKLYNQTKKSLKFELSGKKFDVDGFGSLEIHPDLVPFIESRGLPLKTTPVHSEIQADITKAEAKATAESSDLNKLRKLVSEQKLALEEAEKKHTELGGEIAKAQKSLEEKDAEILSLKEELVLMTSERDAFSKRLEAEGAKAAEDAAKAPATATSDKPTKPNK